MKAYFAFHFSIPCFHFGLPRLWCWRSVAERKVWTDGVVVNPPALCQHLHFLQRGGDLSIQELVPQLWLANVTMTWVSVSRPIALRAAWLFHHPARLPLAHPMRLPRMAHRTTPSFRAQKFPEAMSFSTSFSRLNSDTNRFSFAFSCSRSFSRRA